MMNWLDALFNDLYILIIDHILCSLVLSFLSGYFVANFIRALYQIAD